MKKISRVLLASSLMMTGLLSLSLFVLPLTASAIETVQSNRIILSDTSVDFQTTLSDTIPDNVNVVLRCLSCNNGTDIKLNMTKSTSLGTLYKATLTPLTAEKTYEYQIFSDDNSKSLETREGKFTTEPSGMKTGPTTPITVPIELKLDNPLKGTTTLPDFLSKMLDGAVLLLTPIVVILLIYAGFLFITAQGNAEKLSAAKKALLFTIIGAAIVLGCKGLAIVLQSAVGCVAGAAGC